MKKMTIVSCLVAVMLLGSVAAAETTWSIPLVPYGVSEGSIPIDGWEGTSTNGYGGWGSQNGANYQSGGGDDSLNYLENRWYTMHQADINASLTDAYTLNYWSYAYSWNRAYAWGADPTDDTDGANAQTQKPFHMGLVKNENNERLNTLKGFAPGTGHFGEAGMQAVIFWRAQEAGDYQLDLDVFIDSNSLSTQGYGRLEIFTINDALDTASSEDIIIMNIAGGVSPSGVTAVEDFEGSYTFEDLVVGDRIGIRWASVPNSGDIAGGTVTLGIDAFDVTLIPEPTTVVVLGGGMLFVVKRRKS